MDAYDHHRPLKILFGDHPTSPDFPYNFPPHVKLQFRWRNPSGRAQRCNVRRVHRRAVCQVILPMEAFPSYRGDGDFAFLRLFSAPQRALDASNRLYHRDELAWFERSYVIRTGECAI